MDGSNRRTIQNTSLVWPNGLTIDYEQQRLYWADAFLDVIEYSNIDGSNRVTLETEANGLQHPYALTLFGDLLFWTDWNALAIFSTHKLVGQNIVTVRNHLRNTPFGIEAISIDRQSDGKFILSNPSLTTNQCVYGRTYVYIIYNGTAMQFTIH